MTTPNTRLKSCKLAQWLREHPKRSFFIAGMILWMIFFAAVLFSFEFDRDTSIMCDFIYIPRGSFNPWLFLGLPFLIGFSAGLTGLIYLLKFINWKFAWLALLLITFVAITMSIWENLPQNRFIYALGSEYHKDMRLQTLKTFHSFNNCNQLIAGKFFSSAEMICNKPLKVASNRYVVLKKVGRNIYEFESRFAPVKQSAETE